MEQNQKLPNLMIINRNEWTERYYGVFSPHVALIGRSVHTHMFPKVLNTHAKAIQLLMYYLLHTAKTLKDTANFQLRPC